MAREAQALKSTLGRHIGGMDLVALHDELRDDDCTALT